MKSMKNPIKLSYSFPNIANNTNNTSINKTPIVFLHGLFGNKNNFRGISYSSVIASKRIPIIVDLRNHGSSDHLDSMSYEEMAFDLNFLMKNQLNIDKFTLVGHSMGAKTAMTYSCLYPDDLDGLMIIDSRPCGEKENVETNDIVRKTVEKVYSVKIKGKDGGSRERNDVLQELKTELGGTIANLLNTNLVSDPDLRWRINVKAIYEGLNDILGWKDVGNGKYKGPIRVLNGERSVRFSIDDFNKVFPQIKMRDIRIIQGSGHWVHSDKPVETIDEIGKFIDEIDGLKSKI